MDTRRTMVITVAAVLGTIGFMVGCRKAAPTTHPSALFADITAESAVDFRLENGATGEHFLVETMLGGLGWIDYDGDGDLDLYLVNGHDHPERADVPGGATNRLLQNDGTGRFSDVTAAAGVGDPRYGFGLAVGDYDNDGHSDLLVTNFGRNTLYHNNGNGTFEDVTETAGLDSTGWHTGAAWFDMDRDGDLDLYIARYLRYRPGLSKHCHYQDTLRVYCHPQYFTGEVDVLYRNIGNGVFEDISERAGIRDAGKGLGVAAFDFDHDGLMDIYVANDTTPNMLWHGHPDGTFVDIARRVGCAFSTTGRPEAGMGIGLADLDHDGRTDITVTNFAMETNAVYLATQPGLFSESSRRLHLGQTSTPLSFGVGCLDVELDGDIDLVFANGHVDDLVAQTASGAHTHAQRPTLFTNDGSGHFVDSAQRGGSAFARAVVGRGLAVADFDNDGDADLAMMAIDQSLTLLRNDGAAGGHSIQLELIGRSSPRDAYGARIEAWIGPDHRSFEVYSAGSYLSAHDPRVIIGLGTADRAERIMIHWPSGRTQELTDVRPTSATRTVVEPQ